MQLERESTSSEEQTTAEVTALTFKQGIQQCSLKREKALFSCQMMVFIK